MQTQASPLQPDPAARRQAWHLGPRSRQLRLGSGLILFAYVATHLFNHALLNVSVGAADAMLLVQKAIWQDPIGTTLFYGALLVHAGLGLRALYARRHFTAPAQEAAQLVLGLAIPALLANHLAVTRGALTFYGLDKGYVAELYALWIKSPALGWLQVAVLITAWGHACLGFFFFLRLRRWFPAWRGALLSAAVLLPALALLGFAAGGREVARDLADPAFRLAHLPITVTGTPAQAATLTEGRNLFLVAYAAALLAVLAARLVRYGLERRRGMITIRYPGAIKVRVPPGYSVLEASRLGRFSHASICGGRGRCSTCRVRVNDSAAPLPPPSLAEQRLLAAIAPGRAPIRLACQLRPTGDLEVVPLIAPDFALQFVAGRELRTPGEERYVAAMFVDLRGSTSLMEARTPFDGVFLLGRFIAAVTSSVTVAGGRPVQFLGDGVLALFGLETDPETACRQALDAVRLIGAGLAEVRQLFAQETGRELGFGIGLHAGRAIVGEIAVAEHLSFTALGETINVANRLQELARDQGAQAAISKTVFDIAGVEPDGYQPQEASLRGRLAKLSFFTLPAPAPSLAAAHA